MVCCKYMPCGAGGRSEMNEEFVGLPMPLIQWRRVHINCEMPAENQTGTLKARVLCSGSHFVCRLREQLAPIGTLHATSRASDIQYFGITLTQTSS